MTKEAEEELIALSDLNREDNIKYISSEAQGIAITLDSDRYAPTLCKLERAYICGRRKSEERIEELENKIADIKANCDLAIEGRDVKIKELELELTVEKDLHQEETNLHLHAEEYIKSLEQQIEKMKRCGNCSHFKQKTYRGEYHTQCDLDWNDVYGEYEPCDKWEIEEND